METKNNMTIVTSNIETNNVKESNNKNYINKVGSFYFYMNFATIYFVIRIYFWLSTF
jgi:hypothetical protein